MYIPLVAPPQTKSLLSNTIFLCFTSFFVLKKSADVGGKMRTAFLVGKK